MAIPASPPASRPWLITRNRYPASRCMKCNGFFEVGEEIYYSPDRKKGEHKHCHGTEPEETKPFWDEETLIGEVQRTSTSKYVVKATSKRDNAGHIRRYVDIREYIRDKEGDYAPSRRGISIESGVFAPLAELLIASYQHIGELPYDS